MPKRGERVCGSWGETAAADHAERAGVRVVARNVRAGRGEVDLVLDDAGTLVFAEVKTRRRWALQSGLGAVDWRKRRTIVATALTWLARRGVHPERTRLRFDVFVVQPPSQKGDASRITWIRDAFRADWL